MPDVTGTPSGRAGAKPGELRRQVAAWLNDRPGPHTVKEIADDLGHSGGAVGQALDTLVTRGEADPAATERAPRPDEAAAARRLARALRDAAAGGRDAVTVTSKFPPGRLRMGKALSAAAQRAAGAVPTAEPFTRTTRRRVPAPPLAVGIACDISGSMSAYTEPVASAAWIVASATGHLPSATSATVLFGNNVHVLARPGVTPARVTDFSAPDNHESFCEAVDALDGKLGLARPGKARLLVIVSDTYYVGPRQIPDGQKRMTRLARSGCGILVLRPEKAAKPHHVWADCQVIDIEDPAAAAVGVIARAAVRAIQQPGPAAPAL